MIRYGILYAGNRRFDILVPPGMEVVGADGEGAFEYSLEPTPTGGLVPRVTKTTGTLYLLEEPGAPINDAQLEALLTARLGDLAAGLFAQTELQLPLFGAAAGPASVEPHPQGRYLRLRLR